MARVADRPLARAWRRAERALPGRTGAGTDEVSTVTESDVRNLYWFLLGREPDPSGFESYRRDWVGQRDIGDLAAEMLGSPEFARRAREMNLTVAADAAQAREDFSGVASEQDVFFAYRLLFGRLPDTSGWRNYRGLGDVATLVAALMSSAEFRETSMYSAMTRNEHRDIEVTDAGGFDLLVSTHDPTNRALIDGDPYEPHLTSAFRAHVRPGMHVCDIGANVGYYTNLAASLVGAAGAVIAFEPRGQNVSLVRGSAAANVFGNVSVYAFALADQKAFYRYVRAEGTNGYIMPLDPGASPVPSDVEETIEATSLDNLACLFDRLDVIKLDVEGAEALVLRGGREVIEAHRPVIFTEFSPDQLERTSDVTGEDYLQDLVDLGYALDLVGFDGTIREFGRDVGALVENMGEFGHVDLRCRP